jgi:hypothetical protein
VFPGFFYFFPCFFVNYVHLFLTLEKASYDICDSLNHSIFLKFLYYVILSIFFSAKVQKHSFQMNKKNPKHDS